MLDKEEHPTNIPLISVTFYVLKLDKSIFSKEEQKVNIALIFLIFWVLKLDKSIFIINSHLENILTILLKLFLNKNFILYFPFYLNL